MISPDQAEKAAEGLLQPSKQELAAKQQKLSRRKARIDKIHKLIPPAVAAVAALELVDYFESTGYTVLVAAAIGWGAGLILDRKK